MTLNVVAMDTVKLMNDTVLLHVNHVLALSETLQVTQCRCLGNEEISTIYHDGWFQTDLAVICIEF